MRKATSLFYLYFVLIFFSLVSISCEVINPKEQIPSYISIDKINLTTDYATQGTTANKFTDAWVYIDDQPLGSYPLPALIPVLKEGKHEIKIRGGIKLNGIAATRSEYAFCGLSTQSVDLQLNKTSVLTPTVTYFTDLTFAWLEDFENVGISLVKTRNSDTTFVVTNDSNNVFEGKKSIKVNLDENNSFFECESTSVFSLPSGKDVFLELNYKCNNVFQVGVYSSSSTSAFTTLYVNSSNNTWNKIYINLMNEITAAKATSFIVFISMEKDPNLASATLCLDNIKLIY